MDGVQTLVDPKREHPNALMEGIEHAEPILHFVERGWNWSYNIQNLKSFDREGNKVMVRKEGWEKFMVRIYFQVRVLDISFVMAQVWKRV